MLCDTQNVSFLLFKDFTYLFLAEGKGGRKRERNISVVASCTPLTGDLACKPSMCLRLRIELATL